MIKKIIILSSIFIFISGFDSKELNKAIELYNNSKYKEAINLLKDLSNKYPDEADIHLWLSKSYEATFNLDASLKENRIYQQLKYSKKKEEPIKIEKKVIEEPKKKSFQDIDIDFYQENLFDYSKLNLINPEFISNILSERIKNENNDKKPLNSEIIMDLIFNKKGKTLFKELEIKKNYLINTHEEDIIYKKLEVEELIEEINKLYLEFESVENQDKKNELNLSLKRLAISYNKKLKELIILINKSVYTDTDPLSFKHFLHLKMNKDVFIKTMIEKKELLQNSLNKVDLNIINYSKELEIKKDNNKIEDKINNLTIEANILKEAINKIDDTLLKVNSSN